MCNLATLQYIQQHYGTSDSIRVFDVEGNISSLLSNNFSNVQFKPYQDTTVLISNFIQEQQPDIIYVTPTLLSLNIAKEDTLLSKICLNPAPFGYIPKKTGNFESYILIKNE